MMPLPLLLDIGNILFFIVEIPQVIVAYKNRKNLAGLSWEMLIGFFIGTVCFAVGNYSVGSSIGAMLCIISLFLYLAQIYWKWKYRKLKNSVA